MTIVLWRFLSRHITIEVVPLTIYICATASTTVRLCGNPPPPTHTHASPQSRISRHCTTNTRRFSYNYCTPINRKIIQTLYMGRHPSRAQWILSCDDARTLKMYICRLHSRMENVQTIPALNVQFKIAPWAKKIITIQIITVRIFLIHILRVTQFAKMGDASGISRNALSSFGRQRPIMHFSFGVHTEQNCVAAKMRTRTP